MIRSWRRSACQLAALAMLAASSLAARGAAAAEYCVGCTGPEATYLCHIEGGETAMRGTPGQVLCITEMAKAGNHEACSIARLTPGPCEGQVRIIAAPDVEAPVPVAEEPPAEPEVVSPDPLLPADEEPAAARPPRTVEELAERTVESSKKGLKKAGKTVGDTAKAAGEVVVDTAKSAGNQVGKAGSAVGSAAKKTWNCLTSLFSDC